MAFRKSNPLEGVTQGLRGDDLMTAWFFHPQNSLIGTIRHPVSCFGVFKEYGDTRDLWSFHLLSS